MTLTINLKKTTTSKSKQKRNNKKETGGIGQTIKEFLQKRSSLCRGMPPLSEIWFKEDILKFLTHLLSSSLNDQSLKGYVSQF